MDVTAHTETKVAGGEKSLPLDLSHHYSEVTKRRLASKIKEVYKLFQIPGIRNLAGGLSASSSWCIIRRLHLRN